MRTESALPPPGVDTEVMRTESGLSCGTGTGAAVTRARNVKIVTNTPGRCIIARPVLIELEL